MGDYQSIIIHSRRLKHTNKWFRQIDNWSRQKLQTLWCMHPSVSISNQLDCLDT